MSSRRSRKEGSFISIQKIEDKDNFTTLSQKLAFMSGHILPSTLFDIKNGHLTEIHQNNKNNRSHTNKYLHNRKIPRKNIQNRKQHEVIG